MRRTVGVCLLSLWALGGCAAMHAVTGDDMFRPTGETKPTVRGPNVPEPEPTEPQFEHELQAADDPLPPLPAKKKKSTDVAKK
ncbi:MAG: hypothetical protein JNK82_20415 [Myxococcaceae bacterium]|nr:hypothetical protein [Myxococcaceae bacterium]